MFFLSIRDNNSETNVSFKKARKNECNVIDDGVKIIFKLHLNFYATTILKLLGELLTLLLLAFLRFLVKILVKSQYYYFNEKKL